VLDVEWLGVIRHGESVGNVAAERAEATGSETVDIDLPDPLVPLSERGRDQAGAIGRWLAGLPAGERPDFVVSSPYRRAHETATIALNRLDDPPPLAVDERFRDRELGILDRLTSRGVAARLPSEDARRRYLGKFYYRPPGGESWADVALRLRAALDDAGARYRGRRVLVFAHEAIVHLIRYVVEEASVDDVLRYGRSPLANAGLTAWRRDGDRLRPVAVDQDVSPSEPATRQSHV
jgi:2,3-bisphosphoglycerate-dependent phosphoglycerate mutase